LKVKELINPQEIKDTLKHFNELRQMEKMLDQYKDKYNRHPGTIIIFT
jgi:hypothetical protein